MTIKTILPDFEVDTRRELFVNLVDVQVEGSSIFSGTATSYSAAQGETFVLTIELYRRSTGELLTINQTRNIIVEGVLGSLPQILPAEFTQGVGTITIDTATQGAWELNDVGLNYPINNPANLLDFFLPDGSNVLGISVT